MSWTNVKLIFLREVRDQLRDRRTLFMVAVLPLLLYPLLGVAVVQMSHTITRQTQTVAVIGTADLPALPLIEGDRFVARYFENPDDVGSLSVETDAGDATATAELQEFFATARERHAEIQELARLTEMRKEQRAEGGATGGARSAEEERLRASLADWFNRSPVQVLLVIPENYEQQLDEMDRRLADRSPAAIGPGLPIRPVVLENAADEKSAVAAARVWKVLRKWEDELLQQRLNAARLPTALPSQFEATEVNLADENELAANVWSKLFPVLLVVMAMTGAFYPAIDVGAGEKERGTMETLLICPATRAEIVTGKFFTVMSFSLTTALLNLVSIGFTGKYLLEMTSDGSKFSQFGDVSFPPFSALCWVVLMAIPLASLFSALSLAFAMFARSSKEGQYYLTPLLMIALGLAMICLNPAVEMTAYNSLLPVMGPSLLLKSLLLGPISAAAATRFLIPVILSSLAYSLLALWWAIEQFQREDILFREAERFDLRLWLRHLFRDRKPTPSFMEAGFCFVLILMLQFLSWRHLSHALTNSSAGDPGARMMVIQAVYLLVTVGVPAVLLSLLLTTNARRTLKLTAPRPAMLGAGLLLPLALLPLTQELMRLLGPFFPDLPPDVAEVLGTMQSESLPLWLPLLAFAVAPAVCEELAFRGFILSGMQRSGRSWRPIVLSSIAFGAVHLIPQQVFNAALLGLVLGLLAVRSGSLWPGMLFHLVFNGSQMLLARFSTQLGELTGGGIWRWFVRIDASATGETALRYEPVSLLLCAVVAGIVIHGLIRGQRAGSERQRKLRNSGLPVSPTTGEPARI